MKSKIKYVLIFILLSCNRNSTKVIYQDKIISKIDTINFENKSDTFIAPCKDFETFIQGETIHDTIFINSKKGKLKLKAQIERKVIERQPIIINPQPKKIKIDNSINAKKDSIIGNNNTQKKSIYWWWIFLAGMLTMYILQNVIWNNVKRYIVW